MQPSLVLYRSTASSRTPACQPLRDLCTCAGFGQRAAVEGDEAALAGLLHACLGGESEVRRLELELL